MSQQNPGQPGGQGGAPYGAGPGAPGGYGPAAGYGGGVGPGPGGYPYPGGGPYPGAPQPGGPGGAGKKKQLWIAAGIGCGLVVLLAIGSIIAALLWLRNRSNAFVSDVERQLGNASAAVAAASAQSQSGTLAVELTGDCKSAYVCCRAIATKSTGNQAAVQACEVFKMAGYPQPSCAAALTGYRQVAKAVGVACE